jgi:hypothetical protein
MVITAHQVILGQKERGLAPLSSSFNDMEILNKLVMIVDSVPDFQELKNFSYPISGRPLEKYYILYKTVPASPIGAEKRGGFILSHVLLFDIDEVSECENLIGLIMALPEQLIRVEDEVLKTIDIADKTETFATETEQFGLALKTIIENAGRKTVIWPGLDNYLPLVNYLWKSLWPSMRREFGFSYGSSPYSISKEITILAVPENRLTAWHEYPQVKSNSLTTEYTFLRDPIVIQLKESLE